MTKTAGFINDLRKDCAFSWRLFCLFENSLFAFSSVRARQHSTRISWVRTKLALNTRTDAIVSARFVAIVTSKSKKKPIDSSAQNFLAERQFQRKAKTELSVKINNCGGFTDQLNLGDPQNIASLTVTTETIYRIPCSLRSYLFLDFLALLQ